MGLVNMHWIISTSVVGALLSANPMADELLTIYDRRSDGLSDRTHRSERAGMWEHEHIRLPPWRTQLAASPGLGAPKTCVRRGHFNHRRLLNSIGDMPPAEYELAYYRQREESAMAA